MPTGKLRSSTGPCGSRSRRSFGRSIFTATGESISERDDLRLVSLDGVRWSICEAGPKFSGKAGGNGKDDSRSAAAFRLGAALKVAGRGYEEIRAALMHSDDPGIVAWTLEKGLANGERELRRIFDRSPKVGEDVAELPVVSVSSFAGSPAPPRPWHVVDMIPGRQVTLNRVRAARSHVVADSSCDTESNSSTVRLLSFVS